MMAFMKMLCGMILLKLGRPTFAFSITAGSLKLNGRLHSPKAAAYVAEALSEHLDDMIVWFETDTGLADALWTDVAARVSARGYHCNAKTGQSPARPYYGIGLNGPKYGVHALLICTRRPVLQRNHSAQPRLCCVSKQKPNKAALMQTVSISVHGQEVDLAVVGAGLDSHDAPKEDQVKRLMRHVLKRSLEAQERNRTFQAILVGDLNERLVLKEDDGFQVQWFHRGRTKVGQLSDKSQVLLRHMLSSGSGRRKLLLWHRSFFDGLAAGRVRLRPAQERISSHFFLQTDWWRDRWMEPAPVTYKYTPWEQVVSQEAQQRVTENLRNSSMTQQYVVTADEIVHALRASGESEQCLEPSKMIGLFGMTDKIPKVKPMQEVDQAQSYLNYDRHGRPVYLAFGWLDSVGFLKVNRSCPNLEPARFLDFTTDFHLRAADHALTFGRLELGAPSPRGRGRGVWGRFGRSVAAAVTGALVVRALARRR